MSIIHDALKKVQQSLSPKADETLASPSGTTQKGATYIYATPSPEETESLANQKKADQKLAFQKGIKSLSVFICATTITAGSLWYLYQQYKNDIPRLERSAKKSYYQLIHKEEIPDFKTKSPEELVPLAKITINAPTTTTSPAAQPASVAPAPDPVTLNVHGIMANATGNLVLINNRVYQEGDDVEGAKIVKINLDSITVLTNGTEKTIYVNN